MLASRWSDGDAGRGLQRSPSAKQHRTRCPSEECAKRICRKRFAPRAGVRWRGVGNGPKFGTKCAIVRSAVGEMPALPAAKATPRSRRGSRWRLCSASVTAVQRRWFQSLASSGRGISESFCATRTGERVETRRPLEDELGEKSTESSPGLGAVRRRRGRA